MCSYLPLKAWWYSESEVGKWGRVEWAKRLARQLFLWWKSWYASHSIVPHRAQGTCSCWLEHFCWDHWQVERWCELYIQVPFQKHVRESKQSDKAVLSIHKDRNDRVPPPSDSVPGRLRLCLTLQALFCSYLWRPVLEFPIGWIISWMRRV